MVRGRPPVADVSIVVTLAGTGRRYELDGSIGRVEDLDRVFQIALSRGNGNHGDLGGAFVTSRNGARIAISQIAVFGPYHGTDPLPDGSL